MKFKNYKVLVAESLKVNYLLGCRAIKSRRNLPKFQRFYCIFIALIMKTVSTSETSAICMT
jgi:hypothetical protein